MSASKKPRKAYRPKWGLANTIQLAISGATKPTPDERNAVLKPFRACVRALREGVATELQWGIVSGAVAMCRAVEKIGIMRGITGHLQLADEALDAIYNRAKRTGTWKPTALYYQELDALRDLCDIHAHQVNEMCRSEFEIAIKLATNDVMRQDNMVDVIRSGVRYEAMAEAVA